MSDDQNKRKARRIDTSKPRQTKPAGAGNSRSARRVMVGPVTLGEVVEMRAPEQSLEDKHFTIKAPNGLITLYPPDLRPIDITFDQVGTWIYRWGGDNEVKLEVVQAAVAPVDQPTKKIELPRGRLTSSGGI